MIPANHKHGLDFGDRAIEWLCAGITLWWAIALALPGDILSGPAFVAFNRVGWPQSTWMLLFAFSGGVRVIALWVNGRWPKTPIIRMFASIFGAFVWTQLAWLFYQSSLMNHGPFQTGMGVYGLLAAAEVFSTFRAAHDARYYHR